MRYPLHDAIVNKQILFKRLVPLVQTAKKASLEGPATFLDDLIDACVMECYFQKHMAERNLLFHDALGLYLDGYNPDAPAVEQQSFIKQLYRTLNAPDSVVRNRLLRLTADSPDLLAVIKNAGQA